MFSSFMPNFNIYGMQGNIGAQYFGYPQAFAPQTYINSCFTSPQFGIQNYNFNNPMQYNFMSNPNMGNFYSFNNEFAFQGLNNQFGFQRLNMNNPFAFQGYSYNQMSNPFAMFNSNNYFPFNNFYTNMINQSSQINSSKSGKQNSSNYSEALREKAKSYVGKVNSSAEGNALFSPKGYKDTAWYKKYGRWGWCCDFAVSCAKDAMGGKYPSNMITSSPDGLGGVAKKNGAYLTVPSSNKVKWVEENIKPGNIIHMKGKGDSGKHIAVVDYIKGGKIHAISGNSGGKVREVDYDINNTEIYGFIDVDRIAA